MEPSIGNLAALMKTKTVTLSILLALFGALAVPAVVADESGTKEKKPSKTTLKRYDKDKDGVLNAEEQAAHEAAKAKAKEKRDAKKKAKEAAAEAN